MAADGFEARGECFLINWAVIEGVKTHQGHTLSISADCKLYLLRLSFCPTVTTFGVSHSSAGSQLPTEHMSVLRDPARTAVVNPITFLARLILHAFCLSPVLSLMVNATIKEPRLSQTQHEHIWKEKKQMSEEGWMDGWMVVAGRRIR